MNFIMNVKNLNSYIHEWLYDKHVYLIKVNEYILYESNIKLLDNKETRLLQTNMRLLLVRNSIWNASYISWTIAII